MFLPSRVSEFVSRNSEVMSMFEDTDFETFKPRLYEKCNSIIFSRLFIGRSTVFTEWSINGYLVKYPLTRSESADLNSSATNLSTLLAGKYLKQIDSSLIDQAPVELIDPLIRTLASLSNMDFVPFIVQTLLHKDVASPLEGVSVEIVYGIKVTDKFWVSPDKQLVEKTLKKKLPTKGIPDGVKEVIPDHSISYNEKCMYKLISQILSHPTIAEDTFTISIDSAADIEISEITHVLKSLSIAKITSIVIPLSV
jgi:hypothetical protein